MLTVALAHARFPHLAGGFVGVDVFFVISGFLITGWLVSRVGSRGRVEFVDFYGARARRILPAATLVVVITVVAAEHYLNYVRSFHVLSDGIWSIFFAANIHFAAIGTDYFARDNPPSPLQHFWTLAVEEQFYIVWPILLAALLFVFRGRPPGRRHRYTTERTFQAIGAVLALLVAASLAYSVRATPNDPAGAYFSTPARAWELGTGALLALYLPQLRRLPGALRGLLSWLGVAMIFVAVIHYTAATPFPGSAALLPVLGSAFVICGGIGGVPRLGAGGVVLRRQPFRFVGDVSYSFYLWHWPILIIPMEWKGHELSLTHNVELLLIAFAVSVACYVFFENPIRRSEALQDPPLRSLVLWPCALLVSLGVIAYYNDAYYQKIEGGAPAVVSTSIPTLAADLKTAEGPPPPTSKALVRAVNASVTAKRLREPIRAETLNPSPGDLAADRTGDDCTAASDTSTSSEICHWGSPGSKRRVVLFGDSHARMWIPGVTYFADTRKWDLVPVIKGDCQTFRWAPNGTPTRACDGWRRWALAEVRKLDPKVIVLGTNYTHVPGVSPVAQAGLDAMIDALRRAAPVVLVQDPPRLRKLPVDCILRSSATYGSCTWPITSGLVAGYARTKTDAARRGVRTVPTLQWFVAKGKSPTVIGRTIAYLDDNHITQSYANLLAGAFAKRLDTAIRRST